MDQHSRTEISLYVIDWFAENSPMSKDEIYKMKKDNFLLGGWIDSFKFISLISDIEEKYGVRFTNQEFQNDAFGTIDGLVAAINKKLS